MGRGAGSPYREKFLLLFLGQVAFHRLKHCDQVIGRNLALFFLVERIEGLVKFGELLLGQQIGLQEAHGAELSTAQTQDGNDQGCWQGCALAHSRRTERGHRLGSLLRVAPAISLPRAAKLLAPRRRMAHHSGRTEPVSSVEPAFILLR